MDEVIKHNTAFTVTYDNVDYECYVKNVGYTYAELNINKVKRFSPWFFFGLGFNYTVNVYSYGDIPELRAINRSIYYDIHHIGNRIKHILHEINKCDRIVKHFNL
jgi:hypothetical protein